MNYLIELKKYLIIFTNLSFQFFYLFLIVDN